MDLLDLAGLPTRPLRRRGTVAPDPDAATVRGDEAAPRQLGVARGAIDRVWERVVAAYRRGLYPAMQVCVRYQGRVLIDRAIGYASGAGPDDPPDAERVPVGLDTPFCIFSASKAITAMLIHKLDERGLLHVDDRVCEYIPEFGVHGKQWITIRHVIGHRAGIPNLPPEGLDLDLLQDPEEICRVLCRMRPVMRPGRRLAYHAVSGGFVLGEVVRRVTGQDIREVLRKEVQEPLGLRFTNYGVAPGDVSRVATNYFTGFPVLPPLSTVLERALGVPVERVIEISNDPRFLTGVIPAANVVTTARELSTWYQCLCNGGILDGTRVYEPRTVHRATQEQSYWEVDLTLGAPLRHGLGFMLGGWAASLFGPDTPRAFGHLGFTNMFSWADPQRELAVAILTSGKPVLTLDVLRLYPVLTEIGRAFPKLHA